MNKVVAIDNRYLLAEKIKDGGFGIIHKGYDLKFDKNVVAIKEIHHFYSKDQKFIDMFQDEAVTTAKLNHPNIVNVYDLRVTADKRFYIIMEYIEGIDIRTLIHRCQARGLCIPMELGVYVIGDACKALEHAHNKRDPLSGEPLNIIHRDISPSNIMVTVDGVTKVIDFGIAKARYRRSEETQAGIMKGKVNYMSPEQIHGGHLDHRSDLFSLGIVLFETVTGEKLFWDDSDLTLLNKIAEAKIDPMLFEKYQIPVELREIIIKAVQKDPAERYQSARDMYRDIHSYLQKFSTTDLSFVLSEFVREYYAEELKRRAEIAKDKIKIDKGTEIIKTHSVSSDLAMRELDTGEKEPPPLRDDDETIMIKKGVTHREEVVAKKPAERPAKPVRKPITLPRPSIKLKDYQRELKIAAVVLAAAFVLLVILAIAIPFTGIGKSIHYTLFPLSWQVKTIPPGATVVFDGKTIEGKTPLMLKAKPGSYSVELQRAGFGTIKRTMSIDPDKERSSEYVFQVILYLDSEPQGASFFLNGEENREPTPCEVPWEINKPLEIRMQDNKFNTIDGFTFQGIDKDPEVTNIGVWKYLGVKGSVAKIAITGNFKRNFSGTPFAPKRIEVMHLKKAIELGDLKQGDLIVKLAVVSDSKAWSQLSWFQRKDLPEKMFWQETNSSGEYKILYIGPVDPQYAQTPDKVIEQYKLNDLNLGIQYLVLEQVNLIEDNPVTTVVNISPLEFIFK